MWTHPCGAVLSAELRQSDEVELVAGITMPPGDDNADVTVPGPIWVLEDGFPAAVWAAGAHGLVVTRTGHDRHPALMVWRQDMGDSYPADAGVSLLGSEIVLSPGSVRMAVWRGRLADDIEEALSSLPAWLPAQTIVDQPEELMCHTPDAGILVDGDEHTSEMIGPLPVGAHDLVIHESRGATRVLIGWSPDLATAVGTRVDEIMSGYDPRTVTGPQMWLLMSAVDMRVAPFSCLEMAAEGLENVLSRPFGPAEGHVGRLLTCCAAFRLGHRMGDPELRGEGVRRLWDLPLDEPGTFMSRCIASAELAELAPRHVWVNAASGEGEDLLVRAERAIWTGRCASREADEAVWELGAFLPAIPGGPLYAQGHRVSRLRAALAHAMTTVWPEELTSSFGSMRVGELRQRTLRRLLVSEHLDDEELALLTW
ncbi:hypothetical protein O6R08_07280 [Cutibacterium equinum]|uniref:Uncharacterized protein n=1 Tax=Cutibacterium equinum TaxID=3016342 RepID=A0ABY7R1G8_9ACTN|nr:hypothetical protein [Cutibacterium equinum]WCC81129.1 hypothetical protein O6R08_07280 [Cutibacterium equinum]